jgi:hypothetical protein
VAAERRAASAEEKAVSYHDDAMRGRALAAVVRADAMSADGQIQDADAIYERHARIADQLFEPRERVSATLGPPRDRRA